MSRYSIVPKTADYYYAPPGFRTIAGTHGLQYGFIRKALRFHDATTGKIYTLDEFLAFVPTLPHEKKVIVYRWLRHEEILE